MRLSLAAGGQGPTALSLFGSRYPVVQPRIAATKYNDPFLGLGGRVVRRLWSKHTADAVSRQSNSFFAEKARSSNHRASTVSLHTIWHPRICIFVGPGFCGMRVHAIDPSDASRGHKARTLLCLLIIRIHLALLLRSYLSPSPSVSYRSRSVVFLPRSSPSELQVSQAKDSSQPSPLPPTIQQPCSASALFPSASLPSSCSPFPEPVKLR